jgi:hypothetical protein
MAALGQQALTKANSDPLVQGRRWPAGHAPGQCLLQQLDRVVDPSLSADGELTAADLDAFTATLDATPACSASSRKAYHARLHGLRGVLYQCRVLDVPPKRGRRGTSVTERLALVGAPEIRRVMVRYIESTRCRAAPSHDHQPHRRLGGLRRAPRPAASAGSPGALPTRPGASPRRGILGLERDPTVPRSADPLSSGRAGGGQRRARHRPHGAQPPPRARQFDVEWQPRSIGELIGHEAFGVQGLRSMLCGVYRT